MADPLVVDHDSDLAEVVAELLQNHGYGVRIAHDGEEGLARLEERTPDLVVLDVDMPILQGPGMATVMLLRNCGLDLVPIVLVSGAVGLDASAAEAGTPYSLAKPCSPGALLSLVGPALREGIPPMPPSCARVERNFAAVEIIFVPDCRRVTSGPTC